jgi:hypothetical protein
MYAPPSDRNARARSFLARYTLCYMCIATEADVNVRFCTEPEEVSAPSRKRLGKGLTSR